MMGLGAAAVVGIAKVFWAMMCGGIPGAALCNNLLMSIKGLTLLKTSLTTVSLGMLDELWLLVDVFV